MAAELRTEPIFDALKQPLSLIDNEERRRQIETYIDAARVPVERAVHDLMSQLVQGVDERVGEHYRVRLSYLPGGLGLEIEEKVQDGDEARWATLEGDVEKITIRIPAELKDLATQAAANAGTSANSWFVKALARAAIRHSEGDLNRHWEKRPRDEKRGSSRLSGWVGGDDD